MIAELLASRGRSSKTPPDSIRSFARSDESYSCGLATGPAPYTESRSSDGVRPFSELPGSVGTPITELVSNVMS